MDILRAPRTSHRMHIRRVRRRIQHVLCCLPLCACADAQDGTGDIDSLPQLSATVEARIGSVDDPDHGFSRLGSVDVDRDGNVYALEMLDNQIRVYDQSGQLLRRIGRKGGGPGEFDSPPMFGVKGDTLWAFENFTGRITLFDRAGTVVATGRTPGLRIPLHSAYGYVLPARMRPDGLFTGWLNRVAGSARDTATGVQQGDSIPVPRVLFDAAGAVVDTIGMMSSPPPRMVPPPGYGANRFERITVGSGSYLVPDPPTELPMWHALDDGHIVVDVHYATTQAADSFAVTRINLAGDTVYHTTLGYRPERYTPEQLDSAASRGSRSMMPMGGPAPPVDDAVVNALRAALKFPEFQLPVRYSWLADDESVWLRRLDAGEVARWILLEPDGRIRGELHLSPNAVPLWHRGDEVWASVPDEMDVPWLVRYRISSTGT